VKNSSPGSKIPARMIVVPKQTRAAMAVESKIVGFLDRIDQAGVGGWVVDFANPAMSFHMRILIDDVIVDVINCDLHRDDAGLLKLPMSRIGFYYNIPKRYYDGLRHVLRFSAVEGTRVILTSRAGTAMEELHFCLPKPIRVEGVVDGMVDGLIQGWALNIDDEAKTRSGGLRVLVTTGGQPIAEVLADQYRADVAGAVGCDAACGFTFSPPAELRGRKRVEFRFFALPGRQELQSSPVEVFYPEDSERERISALIARADELFTFAYHLRRELKAALPGERYLLSDYGRWAAKSLPLALPRAIARYGDLPAGDPLVSIICPVYRPAIGDFLAAIDSVRAQSYPYWELLLVDDASKDVGLSQAMQRLSKADGRIKILVLPKNGGIAQASNAALKRAAGQFIAFLDHDDVLEPCALEIMLRAQAATGAKLLYSDEDKIDRSGALSEPHFKPDFNYRFLLDVNYICHFVLVEADFVRRVGALERRFDGAQDHDFLLRLTEILHPEQIHHVSEILYHWRKSASSTAAAGSAAKPKAALAGEAAVAAHLKRRKLAAEVVSREGLTCYQVKWKPPAALKREARVSILIPFRDHVDMTAECVATIRKHTRDVEYEIILLDNWSTSPEAEAFTAAQANMADTKLIRIVEPFNYSRINNLGVQAARHEFILFLNNDVIVSEPFWLRTMLNECLVNERVGAVGTKLLYPDGTVQHAGVVLGVGGVADHAFRGIPGQAPGYVMRAMVAQQISAVTAACMLVRRSAFNAVGGFDERELAVAFNDVDLCVKLTETGWQVVYTPDAVSEHRESISRGDDFDESKIARFMLENEVMRQRYARVLPYDPFYNRHFSRESGVYRELRLLGPIDE
jgi:O-antigen biosynthesis protein